MELKENNISEFLNRARYFHNINCDEIKAIELCNKVLKKDPENRDAMLVKAGSLSSLDKEKESYQLITKIIKKWPDHWEAYYLMGLLLFNTNENMAIENFKKSIKLKKTFDNTISAAQLLYFLEDNSYKEYLKEAENIEPARFKNYMKNYWEWEIC
jgi:tetratricopeptide (TPR) repeat protein